LTLIRKIILLLKFTIRGCRREGHVWWDMHAS